jgi:hypothetical protein
MAMFTPDDMPAPDDMRSQELRSVARLVSLLLTSTVYRPSRSCGRHTSAA